MPWVFKRKGDERPTVIPEKDLKEMMEEREDGESWSSVVFSRRKRFGWATVYYASDYGYEDGVVGEC